MRYGYIRISTKEQQIDRQLTAMYEEGIGEQQIFIDRSSGKDFNREAYQKLLRRLQKGDELVVKSIDRLGRHYDEIIEQWHYLVKEKEVAIKVLDCALLNTSSGINDTITGKFIADMVLQVLSYVAQVERENTLQRQREGIREAKRKGVAFGRPAMAKPAHYPDVCARWQLGQLTIREAAACLDVSSATCYRWLKGEKSSSKPSKQG